MAARPAGAIPEASGQRGGTPPRPRGGIPLPEESIDTTTPTGKLTFHLFAALAEFERDLNRERTKSGLEAARARGRKGGRKPSLSPKKIQVARRMYAEGDSTVAEIAKVLGVSRATIYRHLGDVPQVDLTGV